MRPLLQQLAPRKESLTISAGGSGGFAGVWVGEFAAAPTAESLRFSCVRCLPPPSLPLRPRQARSTGPHLPQTEYLQEGSRPRSQIRGLLLHRRRPSPCLDRLHPRHCPHHPPSRTNLLPPLLPVLILLSFHLSSLHSSIDDSASPSSLSLHLTLLSNAIAANVFLLSLDGTAINGPKRS